MNAPLRPELAALQKASRQAAIITALGALILFGSLGFSAYKLQQLNIASRTLQTQIETLDSELLAKQNKLQSKRVEMDALDQQITILREQKDNLLDVVRQPYKSTATDPQIKNANLHNTERLPIETVVTPHADAQRIGETYPNGKHKIRYWLWLEIPDDRKREIAAVDYYFNHPTFSNPHMVGDPNTPGFRIEYIGWGCMNHLVITLKLKNGESRPLDFDMCKSIWGE